MGRPQPDREGL
jgi:nicotinamide-nucleotide amidase